MPEFPSYYQHKAGQVQGMGEEMKAGKPMAFAWVRLIKYIEVV
jgi:hypothetical protein